MVVANIINICGNQRTTDVTEQSMAANTSCHISTT